MEMEDVKIRRAMIFCLALIFMLSLGFSAASATDSNDFSNLELDEGILSDSIGSNFDDDLVLSDSIDESNDLSNVESDSFDHWSGDRIRSVSVDRFYRGRQRL